jgi:hypothetical protein
MERARKRFLTWSALPLATLAVQFGCIKEGRPICLGPEQCTVDRSTGREVCRCDGWANPPPSHAPDQGVFRR